MSLLYSHVHLMQFLKSLDCPFAADYLLSAVTQTCIAP